MLLLLMVQEDMVHIVIQALIKTKSEEKCSRL